MGVGALTLPENISFFRRSIARSGFYMISTFFLLWWPVYFYTFYSFLFIFVLSVLSGIWRWRIVYINTIQYALDCTDGLILEPFGGFENTQKWATKSSLFQLLRWNSKIPSVLLKVSYWGLYTKNLSQFGPGICVGGSRHRFWTHFCKYLEALIWGSQWTDVSLPCP